MSSSSPRIAAALARTIVGSSPPPPSVPPPATALRTLAARRLSSSASGGGVAGSAGVPSPPPSPSPDDPRPFRILGLQQVAVGSLSRGAMSDVWTGALGLEKVGSYRSERENVDEDILRLGPRGSPLAVEVDLMTPVDAEKSPKVHSPALNHIGLWVDDLPSAVEWMERNGVRFAPGGIRRGASGHDVTFIHPKGDESHPVGGGGVLIELVQAPEDVIEATEEEETAGEE